MSPESSLPFRFSFLLKSSGIQCEGLIYRFDPIDCRFSRHPSYTGFFYWAVATQVLLGNVISVAGFVYVLAKFFEARIIGECPSLPQFPSVSGTR